MDLDVLVEAVDELFAQGGSACSDPESVLSLLRQRSRLDAFVAESVAAFDKHGDWQVSGARTSAAWLRAKAHASRPEARALVRRGRDLRLLPHTARAWADGTITGAHVDLLAPLCTGATGEAFRRDEQLLVEQARTLTYEQFVRAVGYWRQLADPSGSDRSAEALGARRDAYLVRSFSGTWFGQMTLDPISGAIVGDELRRLETVLFEADWSEARERLGGEPTVADLTRSPGQRRADAMVLMATRSKTVPAGGRKPAPLFTVLVGYETMHGRISELEDGTVVPPGSLLPWMKGCDIERAEYRPDGNVAIGATATLASPDPACFEQAVFRPVTRVECAPADRFFTGATRRAIEVRDRHCRHPDCDIRASWCQVDHIQPFAEGGPTTQANGRLLCGPHNRARNQRPPPGSRFGPPGSPDGPSDQTVHSPPWPTCPGSSP